MGGMTHAKRAHDEPGQRGDTGRDHAQPGGLAAVPPALAAQEVGDGDAFRRCLVNVCIDHRQLLRHTLATQ